MKFNKIAVLGETNLPPEIQSKFSQISDTRVDFSNHDLSSEADLVAHTGDSEAILVGWQVNLPRSYFDRCPSLKYVGVCATSTSGIDLEAVKDHGIVLRNVTNYGDEAPAEYIFMQLLKLIRGDGQYTWHGSASELNEKLIGIVGLGSVGQHVARVAQGFNMKVLYHSHTRQPEWEARGLRYMELPDLLAASEIISINVPRNVKVLGKHEFALIRPGSILVDTSIGDILDEAAFKTWITQPDNYAIFDYSTSDKYYQAFHEIPNVIFPKIVAGYTLESKYRLGQKVFANMQSYLAEK